MPYGEKPEVSPRGEGRAGAGAQRAWLSASVLPTLPGVSPPLAHVQRDSFSFSQLLLPVRLLEVGLHSFYG